MTVIKKLTISHRCLNNKFNLRILEKLIAMSFASAEMEGIIISEESIRQMENSSKSSASERVK